MRLRKKRRQPAGGGARSDGTPARAPPSEGAAVAAAPAFDAQATRDKIRAEHAKHAKNYRDAGAENCTWTMDAPDLQKELKAYSAWALAKYPAPGAPLHPVKIAEYVKEVYGKNITDGKWKYSTAQQHLVKMGFIWRHMLASDPATRAVQNTVCPPYPPALGAIPCVKQAMSLAASAGARVHAAQPIIATIETRIRRGDMLAILDSMRSMTPTMPHLAMEANLALSAMLGYRGNNMRALRAVHLLVDTIEVGESETYAALCTTVRQAKKFSSTGNAEDRRGGALRHRDIALCGIGRLALLWMFHAVSDEDSGLRFDDFNDLPKLRERPAFASSYSKKEGYSQPSSGVTTVAITAAKKRCGRESTDKATHLGRLAFAKKAKAYDVDEAQIAAQGGWTNASSGKKSKVFSSCYDMELGHRALKASAGVDPMCSAAEYDTSVPRSTLVVPGDVFNAAAAIFLPSALAYEAAHRGEHRGAPAKNPHLECDRLIKLLKYLLVVMLTDAPFHLARDDKHPVLQHRFFASPLWMSFADGEEVAAVFAAVARSKREPRPISSMLCAAIATPLTAIGAATARIEQRLQGGASGSSSSSSAAAGAAGAAGAAVAAATSPVSRGLRSPPRTSTTGKEIPFLQTLKTISCATEGGGGGFQRVLGMWIRGDSGRTALRDIDFGRARDRSANDNIKLNLLRRLFNIIERRAQSVRGGVSSAGSHSPSFGAMRDDADRRLLIAAKRLDVLVAAMVPQPANMRAFMKLVDTPGARTMSNAQRRPFHAYFPLETRRSKSRKKKTVVAPRGSGESWESSESDGE